MLVNEKFRDLIRSANFATPECLDEVHATYVRYKPGTNCVVRYLRRRNTVWLRRGLPRGCADKLHNATQYLNAVGRDIGFVDTRAPHRVLPVS